MVGKLIRNSAECHECGECLESKSVHDFRSCICGNLSVDGGKEYVRRLYATHNWKETSAYEYPDEQ